MVTLRGGAVVLALLASEKYGRRHELVGFHNPERSIAKRHSSYEGGEGRPQVQASRLADEQTVV